MKYYKTISLILCTLFLSCSTPKRPDRALFENLERSTRYILWLELEDTDGQISYPQNGELVIYDLDNSVKVYLGISLSTDQEVCISPDGKQIAYTNKDLKKGLIRVLNIFTNEEISIGKTITYRPLSYHGARAISFLNESTLVAGLADKLLSISLKSDSVKLLTTIPNHFISSLSVSPNNRDVGIICGKVESGPIGNKLFMYSDSTRLLTNTNYDIYSIIGWSTKHNKMFVRDSLPRSYDYRLNKYLPFSTKLDSNFTMHFIENVSEVDYLVRAYKSSPTSDIFSTQGIYDLFIFDTERGAMKKQLTDSKHSITWSSSVVYKKQIE